MAIDRTGLVKQRKSQFSYGVKTWIACDPKLNPRTRKKLKAEFDPQEMFWKLPYSDWLIRKVWNV